MAFMDTDEYLLLMDLPKCTGEMINLSELGAMRSVGIKTALVTQSAWSITEPSPNGGIDFGYIDRRVDTLHEAGYKTLIASSTEHPYWFPLEWYGKMSNNGRLNAFCVWNTEAQKRYLEYFVKIRDHFNNNTDTLVYDCHVSLGEAIYGLYPAYYNPLAIKSFQDRWQTTDLPTPREPRTDLWLKESYVQMMMDQQSIMVDNHWREIWTSIHPEIANQGDFFTSGVSFIDDIYTEYAKLPGVSIHQIWYTWIQHGGVYPLYRQYKNKFNLQVFGGAEYCEGLSQTVPLAIKEKNRGLIFGPLHPFTGHKQLEVWMLEKIIWANEQFAAAQI
jgi:hypothetical protein